MATPFKKVYEAFLSRITADEWMVEDDMAIVERDWQQLLDNAVFQFKYPRVSLKKVDIEDSQDPIFNKGFEGDLGDDEIQILALFMKHEWIKRCVASWENIRQLYADKDFSQANHLDKLIKLQNATYDECWHAVGIYDRSRNKKPAKAFKKLAGKNV